MQHAARPAIRATALPDGLDRGAPGTRHYRTIWISDIHLGGDPPTPEDRSGRGFRMCTQGRELAAFIEYLRVERQLSPHTRNNYQAHLEAMTAELVTLAVAAVFGLSPE